MALAIFTILCVLAAAVLAWLLHVARLRSVRHEAVLVERTRIARELHDTIVQGLTGLSLHLEGAITSLDDRQRAHEYLRTAKKLTRNSLAEIKRALVDLRPRELEGRDLAAALRQMIQLMTDQLPIRGTVIVRGESRRLTERHFENQLLRIAQEAVTNSLRHAQATHIDILLDFEPAMVRLSVRDDGQGSGQFTIEQLAAATYGVCGMRERAEEIGARFMARNRSERGMEIAVEVPG